MNKKILYLITPLQILLYLLIIPLSQSIRETPEIPWTHYYYIVIPLILSAICTIQVILLSKNSSRKSYIKLGVVIIYFIFELFKIYFSFYAVILMIIYMLFLPFFVVFSLNWVLGNSPRIRQNRYVRKSMQSPFFHIKFIVGGILCCFFLALYIPSLLWEFLQLYNFSQNIGDSSPLHYFQIGDFVNPRVAFYSLMFGLVCTSVFFLFFAHVKYEKKPINLNSIGSIS